METHVLMEPQNLRDKQQALDEINRELNVRRRCFNRWIAEGRLSQSDAQDRIDRLATAAELLSAVAETKVEVKSPTSNGKNTRLTAT
jgi:hypothetical protein